MKHQTCNCIQFKCLNDDVQKWGNVIEFSQGSGSRLSPTHKKERSRGYTPASLLSNSSHESWHFDAPELPLKLPQYVVLSEKKVPDISSNQVRPPTHPKKNDYQTWKNYGTMFVHVQIDITFS